MYASKLQGANGQHQAAGPSASADQHQAARSACMAQPPQQQQQHVQSKQPRQISTMSVRQLFIKRHSPSGQRTGACVTPQKQPLPSGQHSAGRTHWGDRWQQLQSNPQYSHGAPQPGSSLGNPLPASREPQPAEQAQGQAQTGFSGESQGRRGPPFGTHSRPPLAENQQGDPSAASRPSPKPQQPQGPLPRPTAPLNAPYPAAHAGNPPGQPGSFGQLGPPAGSASVRLPQSFPPPLGAPAGSHLGGSAAYQQGPVPHSTSAQPNMAAACGQPSGLQPAGVWPHPSRHSPQQQPQPPPPPPQQQQPYRPGSTQGQRHRQQQRSHGPGSTPLQKDQQQPQWPGERQPAAGVAEREQQADTHRRQQACMGSWATRAEMEDDFVVALPKQAAAAATKSASAPAAGRPAKAAPDPARNTGNSAPAGNAAQMPPWCAALSLT